MEKLIHERLREIANNRWLVSLDVDESSSRDAIDIVRESLSYVEEGMSYCVDMQNILNYIADEIEKYYDPKLRFEDGEPAKEGDKYVDQYGHECTISSIDKRARIWDENCGYEVVDVCKSLKRPKSKVLDADGIEIKVGETLYRADHAYNAGKEVHVYGIGHIEDAPHSEIQVFTTPKCTLRSGWEIPSNLTHREPDSLEKLRDEIQKDADELEHTPYQGTRNKLNDYADRLTAIIERDA